MTRPLSRRTVLSGAGALTLFFGCRLARSQTETGKPSERPKDALPGSLADTPRIDSWIRIDAKGQATIFTGKAELGQGLKTALLQIASEELKIDFAALRLITADTEMTADEGYTAASHSIQDSGTAIRHAAAQVRELLIDEAAVKLGTNRATLRATDGAVVGPNDLRISYAELVRDQLLAVNAQPVSRLTATTDFNVMNHNVPRIDIPAKVTGAPAYVQDLRPEAMLHARIVRPPAPGAKLKDVDIRDVERTPGVVKVIRDGDVLAVVAEQEWTAIQAMRRLATLAGWAEAPSLPDQNDLATVLTHLPSDDDVILDRGRHGVEGQAIEGVFTRPYLAHGSIGPSCAIALAQDSAVTVWTHTQGVFPLRKAIAEMLRISIDRVRCIHVEGAGCYGQNGADDVAADAALLAVAVPGRPIRVQWMREQEHSWEPFGPGMVVKVRAVGSADGSIAEWHHEVWSQSHMMRPGPAGALLAAQMIANPFPPAPPVKLAQPEGGGDRNAIPLYSLPNAKVVHHFLPEMPLRGSSMRSLGGYLNVVAIESTMDDLARHARIDPVEFRLRHLTNMRGRAVIEKAAGEFGWAQRSELPRYSGYGFAFAQYKNLEAYCAIAMEISVEPETGRVRISRIVAAVDTGEIVSPDGVRNQIEGGIIQSSSWTLFEQVTFDQRRVTSVDWSAYPIMRFSDVPLEIAVHLVNQPGAPFIGVAEAAQGPTGAALSNAICDAIGSRLYELPFSSDKIRNATANP
ncbi:xanthine dehydrogenase family protein molybdopterin-binding subunit [Tardiphaga alba]|uniref:Xanthine dehydrogenase family protein molybdopterin-binding subunit n=1 Tax=Tardiphaga alba TaxID=340268 RepID=A0ABX8A390_9BRAD|nr:molybdopterin cofactor-binding domain-containing protein [Tardiphaga alba]QUS38048.1 xanthine dehydrogenase family protein molybdopterin-binding subunit [Tardiphaga alba]